MDAESEGVPPAHPLQVTVTDHVGQNFVNRKRKLMTQPSTVAVRRQQAVCVRRAHKTYGTKKNPNVVLDGLSMTVPKGTM